jgi:hypothetical protein
VTDETPRVGVGGNGRDMKQATGGAYCRFGACGENGGKDLTELNDVNICGIRDLGNRSVAERDSERGNLWIDNLRRLLSLNS